MNKILVFIAIFAIIYQIIPSDARNIMNHKVAKRSLRSEHLHRIHAPSVADIVTK